MVNVALFFLSYDQIFKNSNEQVFALNWVNGAIRYLKSENEWSIMLLEYYAIIIPRVQVIFKT